LPQQSFGSKSEVLFDTFSFKKKYQKTGAGMSLPAPVYRLSLLSKERESQSRLPSTSKAAPLILEIFHWKVGW